MKILMIAPYPYPGKPIRGGVETVTYNLMEGFKSCKDVEVKILSICRECDETIKVAPNIIVEYLKPLYSSRKVELKKHIKPLLLDIDKEWKPDIIHFQGNGSMFLLYDESIKNKLVITQHGILWNEMKQTKSLRPKLNMLLAYLIEQRTKRKTKNWIFISQYNQDYNSKFIQKSKINFRKIYNPVNPMFFEKIEQKDHAGINLLFVGRIMPRKGLGDLLVGISMTKNPDIKLHVVGGYENKDYQRQIETLIQDLHLTDQVIMHGWKTSDEIIELYSSIDAFVLPSYQETLPCVIAEAMAIGKPVIATTVGGITEMIDDGETGFLYPVGDTKTLSECIKRFSFLNPTERNIMSKKTQAKAERLYNPNNVAKEHLKFYNSIICISK